MSRWPVAKPEGQIPQKCQPQSQRCCVHGVARMAVRERAGERGEEKTEVGESGGKGQRRKRGRMGKKKGGEEESRRGWVGGVSAGETNEKRLLGREGRNALEQEQGRDGGKGRPQRRGRCKDKGEKRCRLAKMKGGTEMERDGGCARPWTVRAAKPGQAPGALGHPCGLALGLLLS